jgi:hypothetical protein
MPTISSWRPARVLRARWLAAFWHEHGSALAWYVLLSLALAWSLLPTFATHLLGRSEDPLNTLWVLWHTQQAVLGQQPLFHAPDLYYPHGISLLAHGLGPLTGLLALPFWPWGPAATHNATVLLSLTFSGYAMYLLARSLGFARGVALFAGTLLLLSPMSLAGVQAHLTKVFLATLPLTLLALHHALNPQRSRWWVAAVGVALLAVLLHNGYQFVYAALACAFFSVALWLGAAREERREVALRAVLAGAASLLLSGPLLAALVLTTRDAALGVEVDLAFEAQFSPDALSLSLPSYFNALLGEHVRPIMERYAIPLDMDHAIFLPWFGVLLCIIGLLSPQRRRSRLWVFFTLLCALLALGPTLRWFGTRAFTPYDLEIPLPYALLRQMPGLGFMRASGRIMTIGYVGFGIAASFGLAWLVQRWPRYRLLIVGGAIALLLLENWPRPFPQQPLPTVPAFYQQLADDAEHYGVVDLPLMDAANPRPYPVASAPYQMMQMTHEKGILTGYVARTYQQHPVFPGLLRRLRLEEYPHMRVNGAPAHGTGPLDFRRELLAHNYRYLVLHKTVYDNPADERFVAALFRGEAPLVDDALARVYALAPAAGALPMLEPGPGWHPPEEDWRWAASPAVLNVSSLQLQPALLHITPATLYDPSTTSGFGGQGTLEVHAGTAAPQTIELTSDQTTTLPLLLPEGTTPITLALQAGSFRPTERGGSDDRRLSFAVRSLDLHTVDAGSTPPDVQISTPPAMEVPPFAAYDTNWFGIDPAVGGRWAATPATLYIYSPIERPARLRFTPVAADLPADATAPAELTSRLNGRILHSGPLRLGEPRAAEITLQAGWNPFTLDCRAGAAPCSLAVDAIALDVR